MNGMMFTEFMEMVETAWSLDMVDRLIEQAGVSGAYTAIGVYPHQEMLALLGALSTQTGTPVPDLVRDFGKHLFGRFALAYPRFFQDVANSLDFLADIEGIVHAEIRKVYPDADLPSFEVERIPDGLVLNYYSSHAFVDLAHGLIEGCAQHFGDRIQVVREAPREDSGAQATFIVKSVSAP